MNKFLSVGLVFFATVVVAGSAAAQSPVAVTTYHYDTLRTGWNSNETTLTPQNVNATTFGMLTSVTLDDQVDAQPLIVPNQKIAGSTHDVVYVATESNTIYAIDASSGAKLFARNLGSPVPKPLGCGNNGSAVGITGTPVIDLPSQTLYVIAYVNGSPPIYQLHALNLSDLTDKVPAVTVAATHMLSNGATYTFNAAIQRQRPALLKVNGAIYAGFGSFCDFSGSTSRGWLLGWNASTLTPGTANQLNDTQATSPVSIFLSSIWMSGYGIATAAGDLYFSTSNSDCNFYVTPINCAATTTYDGVTNIQESVVKIHGDLTHIDGIFTPSNVASLDKDDGDLGSGGVLLVPPQSGTTFQSLVVTAGKDGILYLLNGNDLGGFTPGGPNRVLDAHRLGGCWCGPSFFTGSDGIGRVVTSQGASLQTWQLQLSPSPKLVLEGTASIATGGQLQDPGFFTSVSSNGTTAGTAIIWAVGRPTVPTAPTVTLYAFAATATSGTFTQLFSSPAGNWPNTGADANIVPVVANGKVYVAAYRSLTIFGILPVPATSQIASQPSPILSPESPHEITGTLLAVNGSTLTLQTHTGKNVKIDASQAMKNQRVGAPLNVGMALTVQGSLIEGTGALLVTSMYRAKGSAGELWPPDR